MYENGEKKTESETVREQMEKITTTTKRIKKDDDFQSHIFSFLTIFMLLLILTERLG